MGGTGTNTLNLHGQGELFANFTISDFANLNVYGPNNSDLGRWEISGNHSFTNDITVHSGNLSINGTLSANNDLSVMPNATLEMDVSVGNVNAGNHATVDDASLSVYASRGIKNFGSIRAISADNGVIGQFSSFNSHLGIAKSTLRYEPDGVYIDLSRTALNTPNRAPNDTSSIIAQGIDNHFDAILTPELVQVFTSMNDVQMANLLNSQSGQITTSSIDAVSATASANAQIVLTRAANGANGLSSGDVTNPNTFWFQATGAKGKVDGNKSAMGTKYSSAGVIGGIEREFEVGGGMYGLFAGYAHSDSHYNHTALKDKGDTNMYQLGLYAGRNYGALGVTGSVSGAYLDFTTKRPTTFGVAQGSFSGAALFADVELAYSMATAGGVGISPILALEGGYIHQQSYRENGAGVLNLNVASANNKSLVSVLGLRAQKTFAGDVTALTTALQLGWAHQYLDRGGSARASMVDIPTVAYTTDGTQRNRDSARVGLDIALVRVKNADKGLSGYFSYNGDFANNANDQSATIGIRYRW